MQISKAEEKKTKTDNDQEKIELKVLKLFEEVGFTTKSSEDFQNEAKFYRILHYDLFKKQISQLSPGYINLDSGYPWFIYWILNCIVMCKDNNQIKYETKLEIVQLLKELQHEDGGFRGVAKCQANIISTYAAVMGIVCLGIPEAYDIIDIPKMKNFLLRMKNNNFNINQNPSYTDKNGIYVITKEIKDECKSYHSVYPGAFQNHESGESDLRSTYCALIVASVLNLINWNDLDNDPLTKGVVDYVKNCQTFEGGLGPEPFCEAHGGYSFCGIATLALLKKLNEIDVNSFLRWLVSRQMTKEGGFNGRTNKLVDSCYSFWQGSVFNMLYMADKKYTFDDELLYDQLSLQAYILFACQNTKIGGLIDKPGKYPDLYHSNYSIASLSLSQQSLLEDLKVTLNVDLDDTFVKVNPIYCAPEDKIEMALKYYAKKKNI